MDERSLLSLIAARGKGTPIPAMLRAGIGDDCAVFDIGEGRCGLLTTDISVEKVHFFSDTSPFDIGYKAMIGNISDISAMGGRSLLAFVSLGLPACRDEAYVNEIYRGLNQAAVAGGCAIAGGDLSRSSELVLNIALYGEAERDDCRPVMRGGALAGDTIYVTGHVGDAACGLEIIRRGPGDNAHNESLVERHLRPPCRAEIVRPLVDHCRPRAMIDISDGLLLDLSRLCDASGRGFELYADRIPVSAACRTWRSARGEDWLLTALGSGEEYELLFTAADESLTLSDSAVPLTAIGRVTAAGRELVYPDGRREPAAALGFDHFAG